MSFQIFYLFRNDWNTIFTNYYTFHFYRTNFGVPIVISNILNFKPLCWVSVQNFLNKVFVLCRYEAWDQKVTSKNLFVQLICIWIFKRQITTSHCIQNDSTRPDICTQSMISFTCNHFRCCIAWTPTCCFQCLSLNICI